MKIKGNPSAQRWHSPHRRRWVFFLAALFFPTFYALVFGGPYRPLQPLPPDILDMHCHLAGIGAGGSGCFVSVKLWKSRRFSIYLKSFGVTQKELAEKGDGPVADHISQWLAESHFVKRAVVLALDGAITLANPLDRLRTLA